MATFAFRDANGCNRSSRHASCTHGLRSSSFNAVSRELARGSRPTAAVMASIMAGVLRVHGLVAGRIAVGVTPHVVTAVIEHTNVMTSRVFTCVCTGTVVKSVFHYSTCVYSAISRSHVLCVVHCFEHT